MSIKDGIRVIIDKISKLGDEIGVYKMLDASKTPIYIGKAKNIPKRLQSYTNIEALPDRLKLMVSLINAVEILVTNTEQEALLLEAELISTIKPRFNIRLKDDKSMPYIAFSADHQYPRIYKYHGRKQKSSAYFGPFASFKAVKHVMEEIQRVFRIRPCSDEYFKSRTKPCMQHQIKRCDAPCVGKISQSDYAQLVKDAKCFLSGENLKVHETLQAKMLEASNNMQYELAMEYRDRLSTLNQIRSDNKIALGKVYDADIVAFHFDEFRNLCIEILLIRHGRNYGNKPYIFFSISEHEDDMLELLLMQIYQSLDQDKLPSSIIVQDGIDISKLQYGLKGFNIPIKVVNQRSRGDITNLLSFMQNNAKLELSLRMRELKRYKDIIDKVGNLFDIKTKHSIERIEVYDNSHLSGTDQVGCYIVAGPEGFIKKQYRHYSIKTAKACDDYGMLREVLLRRVSKLSALENDECKPDLIIIDGGIGHFNIASDILPKHNIPFICMAKGEDRNAGREVFFREGFEPFQLPTGHEVLLYMQMLRDEAHRFAITTQKKRRNKHFLSQSASELDAINGIGKLRKKALLMHFGSIAELKKASLKEIESVPGVGKKAAKLVYDGLCV